jgi:putative hydrolase of the HAD superfamily
MSKDYTHIFFDVGSVLLKRKDDLWAMASDCLGVSLDAYREAVFAIHNKHKVINSLWSDAKTLEKEIKYYTEFSKEVQKRLGIDVDESKTKYLVNIFSRRRYDLSDGAHEILKWLKSRGYILGVISNAPVSRRHYEMKEHELEQYFDLVVLSRDISIDKPHPKIYEYALNLAGATAKYSVMIDDRAENLKTAQELGFGKTLLFVDSKSSGLENPYTRISHLSQLRSLL